MIQILDVEMSLAAQSTSKKSDDKIRSNDNTSNGEDGINKEKSINGSSSHGSVLSVEEVNVSITNCEILVVLINSIEIGL